MKNTWGQLLVLFLLGIGFFAHAGSRPAFLRHQMLVQISPAQAKLQVVDHVIFSDSSLRSLRFSLHKNLQILSIGGQGQLHLIKAAGPMSTLNEWEVLGLLVSELTLTYEGNLDLPSQQNQSEGFISKEGAALLGGLGWYALAPGMLHAAEIKVRVPEQWTSLSQGERLAVEFIEGSRSEAQQKQTTWSETHPQQDLNLIAGPYFEYEQTLSNQLKIRVLLLKDEKALAQNFLDVLPGHLGHYSTEISNYPYPEMTVAENFWETGYGLPGFTLLGPTVIRLPFLLTSSLPHEVLHNWWGNGVFVDPSSGNWCEGLTTYMGDHWQQELVHQDESYRLNTLITFEDYVKSGNDFPVREFQGRHDSSTQAIGYGKSMMVFHMLKNRYGAFAFQKSLQDFYIQNQFQLASFSEIQKSFEVVTGKRLDQEFGQWLDQKGAPTLSLEKATSTFATGKGYQVQFILSQRSESVDSPHFAPYDLMVPVELYLKNGTVLRKKVPLARASETFHWISTEAPLRLEVDSHFDLFRTLSIEEHPASLSAVLGADSIHFYAPEGLVGVSDVFRNWQGSISGKSDLSFVGANLNLESSGALVLIGDDSRFAKIMEEYLVDQDFSDLPGGIRLQGQVYDSTDHSWLLVARNRANPKQIIVWLRWAQGQDPSDWSGRLLHYGKYGALVFKARPNVLKITWPVQKTPLKFSF